jgi:integrase
MVSTEAKLLHNTVHSRTHRKYAQHLAGHASIKITLDRYSHWMPSMGRNTAEGIDEALG